MKKLWWMVAMGAGLLGTSAECWGQSPPAPAQAFDKFSLIGRWCEEGMARVCGTPSAALPTEQHAQQLSVYSQAPAITPPSEIAPPAVPAWPKTQGHTAALSDEIDRVAQLYQIDPLLLHAIAHVESRHNPRAISPAGAVGLMQVMPTTAQRFGVGGGRQVLHDARTNLEVACAYLKTLQQRFDNNLTLVIAAYNAGEGAVEKYGRQVPPYKETQGYVRDVKAQYKQLLAREGR